MEVIFILSALVLGVFYGAKQVSAPDPAKHPEVAVAVQPELVKAEAQSPPSQAVKEVVSSAVKRKLKIERGTASQSKPLHMKTSESGLNKAEQEKQPEAASAWGTKKELSTKKWEQ